LVGCDLSQLSAEWHLSGRTTATCRRGPKRRQVAALQSFIDRLCTYAITNNNPIQNRVNGSNGITFGKTSGSGTATGTVTGNTITKADCGNCAGMRFNGFGAGGTSNATITGNTISTVNEGVLIAIGQGSTTNNVVIQSNTISGPVGSLSGFAIDATNGTQAGDNPCTVLPTMGYRAATLSML
jgi:hypothetical protein